MSAVRVVGEVAAATAGLCALAMGGAAGVALGVTGFSYALGSALTTGGPFAPSKGWVAKASPLQTLCAMRDENGGYTVPGPFLFTEAQWAWYMKLRSAERDLHIAEKNGDVCGAILARTHRANAIGGPQMMFLKADMVESGWLHPDSITAESTRKEQLLGDPSYYMLTVGLAQAEAVTDEGARYKLGLPPLEEA